jgi:hypothetical protein
MDHAFELPPKAMKLLALALNDSATEGEWQSAAIKAVADMRKAGVPVAYFEATKKPERGFSPSPSGGMPFGKFKGTAFADLPDWYLEWIKENLELREPLLSKIAAEVARRAE